MTDTYDAATGTLYEAKAKSDRATIRLAVGQLLDYLALLTHLWVIFGLGGLVGGRRG